MGSHLHIARPEFAGDHAHALFSGRVFHPEKILGQRFAKAPVNLTNSFD